jgi:GNAT superfamily N-acetyltransferase
VKVELAESDDQVRACHAVMQQLRTHLDAEQMVARVKVQRAEGYKLAALRIGEEVAAVAGYRLGHNLAWGRYLYVDDLVTDGRRRSQGAGRRLLDWLVAEARAAGCDELHLDSGVQRFEAHRFYLRAGMDITSHHFAVSLRDLQEPPT